MESPTTKKVERSRLKLPTLNFGPISPVAFRTNTQRRTRIFDHKPVLLSRFQQMERESNSQREDQSVYAHSAVIGNCSDEFDFRTERFETQLMFKEHQIKKITDQKNLQRRKANLKQSLLLEIQCEPIHTSRSNTAFSRELELSYIPVVPMRKRLQNSFQVDMEQSYTPSQPSQAEKPTFSQQPSTPVQVQIKKKVLEFTQVLQHTLSSPTIQCGLNLQSTDLLSLNVSSPTLTHCLQPTLTCAPLKRCRAQGQSQTRTNVMRRVGQVQLMIEPNQHPSPKVIQLENKLQALSLQLSNQLSVNNLLLTRDKECTIANPPLPPAKKVRSKTKSTPAPKKSLMDAAVGTLPEFKLAFYLIAILTTLYRLFARKRIQL